MRVIYTLAFLLSFGILHAQDHYMSLAFVGASPVGDFANNQNLMTDGFAIQGFGADYTGAYYLNPYIGGVGKIRFFGHPLDEDAVRTELEKLVPENLPEDVILYPAEIGNWGHVSFLIGPQFTLPVNKFRFDAYATGGLSIILSPDLTVRATQGEEMYARKFSANNTSFGFDAGLSIRYLLNENYGLKVFGSMFQATVKGKVREEIESGVNPNENTETDYSMTLRTINFGIGVVYRL